MICASVVSEYLTVRVSARAWPENYKYSSHTRAIPVLPEFMISLTSSPVNLVRGIWQIPATYPIRDWRLRWPNQQGRRILVAAIFDQSAGVSLIATSWHSPNHSWRQWLCLLYCFNTQEEDYDLPRHLPTATNCCLCALCFMLTTRVCALSEVSEWFWCFLFFFDWFLNFKLLGVRLLCWL